MNVGLNLLRIVLTLGVIMDHFWWMPDPESLRGVEAALWEMRTLAVPAFMTMTFFFTAKRFAGGDVAWLRKRYLRLYEPFVFWAAICFFATWCVSRFDATYSATLKDLLWQLALGHSEHLSLTQFWFHTDLIILTAVFFGLFWVVRRSADGGGTPSLPVANPDGGGTPSLPADVVGSPFHRRPGATQIVISLLAIAVGFTVQYSSTAMEFLFGWMPFEAKYPLGRIVTMLPYAGVGLLLASVKDRLDAAPAALRWAIAATGLWLALWVIYGGVAPRPESVVGYEGLSLALIAWGVMALFYYIPFDRLPPVCSKAVLFLSKYCMGVYCIHHIMGKILFDHVFHFARTQTPFGPVTVAPGWFWLLLWALSYLVCYLITLVPGAFSKRIVQ